MSNFQNTNTMLKGFFNVPKAVNEPVKSYAPDSPERAAVAAKYTEMWRFSNGVSVIYR